MGILDKIRLFIIMGWRNIRRQFVHSMIVISAAATGMIGILFTMGFMNGFSDMMLDAGIKSGLGHVQIRPIGYIESRKTGMLLAEPEEIRKILDNIKYKPEVKYSARFDRDGMIRLGNHSRGVQVMGVEPQAEQYISQFRRWLVEGEFLRTPSEQDRTLGILSILIGKANAEIFEVSPGDTIVLSITDHAGEARTVQARVSGIFVSPAEPINKFTVLTRREDLSRLYRGDPSSVGYFVFVGKTNASADGIKRQLQSNLKGEEFEVLSYKDLEPGINNLIELSDQMMLIFYFILMSGFALTLLNTVLRSVMERTREIGILRAIGSQDGVLFWMIIFEGMVLTMVGCGLGLLLGGGIILVLSFTGLSLSAFARGMELMGNSGSVIFPHLLLSDMLMGFTVGLFMSVLAALYPAGKAIRMVPVKAIYNR